MRGRPALRTFTWKIWDPALLRSLFLAAVFIIGALGGHLYAGDCDAAALDAYLTDYCAVYDAAGGGAVSLPACIALYYGYAAAVFLLGFASIGVAFIPALTGAYGFFTMYTVSCFVRTYGRSGILLAMGALSVRLLFTMPCFFILAGAAWPLSTELATLAFGHGKRSSPVLYEGRYFLLFGLCALILTAGIFCERFLTPLLFRLAMGRVLSGA